MSYETAPATKMLATTCLICGRPLVDSVSVEAGIGPTCRERSGYHTKVSAEARVSANRLIHALAVDAGRGEVAALVGCLDRLVELGFDKIASIVAARFATIRITYVANDRFEVSAPYDSAAVDSFRSISGRRFETKTKCWSFPMTEKAAVWERLNDFYTGIGYGPKGFFGVGVKS